MPENYMLDALDKLTLKHVSLVLQTNDAGIQCISEVDHDPLLTQLRDAVAGGISKHAGALASRERIPLNSGAMETFDAIAKQINAWYRILPGAVEERYIHDRLRDWYIDFENRRRAGKVTDSAEHDALKLLEGWVRNIEGMFDPPTVFELTHIVDGHNVPIPCPVCGEARALDPRTKDQITALVIEYRNLGVETLDKASGLCRFCETIWRGRNGVRELRWLIDQADSDTPELASA